MLDKIELSENLAGLARSKSKKYVTKTIKKSLLDDYTNDGWEIDKDNEKTVRMKKYKPHYTYWEDKIWMLLYRMDFQYLSLEGGSLIDISPQNDSSPKTQIDVVGIDKEIALAIECKSAEQSSKRNQFGQDIGKHLLIRNQFIKSVKDQFPSEYKRQIVLAIFTSNILLNDNDKERAKSAKIMIFDEKDVAYYESLIQHIGPSAKYQFFADMMQGKTIDGLTIRLPAIMTKMGGTKCYTFSINPEYLLKISYVSHRSKGKLSDVNTYQRMLKKSRLKNIKKYISDDGIFPTNIVLNIDKNKVDFERIKQESDNPKVNGLAGWLTINPSYKWFF